MQIATALERYLISSNTHVSSSKEKKFYISDMSKCKRMRFLKRKGVGAEYDPFVNWIFKMGELIHDFGYKGLESQGLLLSAEETMFDDNFVGRYDGTIKNIKDGLKSVFDFKSISPYGLKKIMDGGGDEASMSQVLSYTMMMRERHEGISDTGSVVYINKAPSDQIPQVFFQKDYHLTPWREGKLKDEMKEMVEFWDNDKIPICTCSGWSKGPKYNQYFPLCQAEEKDIKKYLKMVKDNDKKLITTKTGLYLIDGENRKELIKL